MPQIEEDTDRDRYMSPLEAKAYGLIDQVVGGDDAVFKVDGSTRAFPKTKEQYVNWGDDDMLDGSRGSRWARVQGGAGPGGEPGSRNSTQAVGLNHGPEANRLVRSAGLSSPWSRTQKGCRPTALELAGFNQRLHLQSAGTAPRLPLPACPSLHASVSLDL